MKLIKYGKSLTKGKLKAIHTIKHVHLAFQTKEPFGLELGGIFGSWFSYMDVETMLCGHLYHPNCLHVHLQESTSCKKCGQFLHPLWFDSKRILCMEKEEYEKQRLPLGLEDEMKMWLKQH